MTSLHRCLARGSEGAAAGIARVLPEVTYRAPHPFAEGDVRAQVEQCELALGNCVFPSPAFRIIVEEFGVTSQRTMVSRFGNACQLLALFDRADRALFSLLFSDEDKVRKRWATGLAETGSNPSEAGQRDRAIIDFVAIPRCNRGSAIHYAHLALDYLFVCGYKSILSECQDPLILSFWKRRLGAHLLNPPPPGRLTPLMYLERDEDRLQRHHVGRRPRKYLDEPVYLTIKCVPCGRSD